MQSITMYNIKKSKKALDAHYACENVSPYYAISYFIYHWS